MTRLLVVGGGAREHALVWKFKSENPALKLYAAPGNPGIAELATCVPVGATDIEALIALAHRERIDVTVVGPEAPLAAGIVDQFREHGLAIFGPTRAAARIETSKAFAKALMLDAGVPTARAVTHTDPEAARRVAREFGAPVVIKASGLAAGKGVVVCETIAEADAAIDMMLVGGGMGEAGREILVEEFMEGEELSVFALTDGVRTFELTPAQDHKRLFDGDRGPNTGGMGAYAPVSIAQPLIKEDIRKRIIRPVLEALTARGSPFTGLLYAGLMLTRDGAKVVEFNCRFGDPETQAVLPLIDIRPPLHELVARVARGEGLPDSMSAGGGGYAVATVVAAPGYPEKPETGHVVRLPRIEDVDVLMFHAGTRRNELGQLVTAGGRVLTVTAVAGTFEEAQHLSSDYAARVDLPGKLFRADIGWRELPRAPKRRAGAS
ncbi:MAG: phosphoribosylamine--glycine ligase [Gemmatimonadaceae bacterium]